MDTSVNWIRISDALNVNLSIKRFGISFAKENDGYKVWQLDNGLRPIGTFIKRAGWINFNCRIQIRLIYRTELKFTMT